MACLVLPKAVVVMPKAALRLALRVASAIKQPVQPRVGARNDLSKGHVAEDEGRCSSTDK